jgi:CBS domain-containing protein
MKVKHLMRKSLIMVPISATIYEAALKMRENRVGSVLVVDKGAKLEGLVTDRDIAMAVAVDGKEPGRTCVYDIMTDDLITIRADDDIASALRFMNTANVRRLPVCKNGKVAGIISSADIASGIKEEVVEFMGLEEAYAK